MQLNWENNSSHSGLWMDFSGTGLKIYTNSQDRTQIGPMPYNVTLQRSYFEEAEIRRTLHPGSNSIGPDRYVLNGFHRYLPLMEGRGEIRRFIWMRFFMDNKKAIISAGLCGHITALVPTAWEPEIAADMEIAFSSVFTVGGINICTEAAAGVFRILLPVAGKPKGLKDAQEQDCSIAVIPHSGGSRENVYTYRLKKTNKSSISVVLQDWKTRYLAADKAVQRTTYEVFRCFYAYLEGIGLPRVDMVMYVTVGMLNSNGKFLQILDTRDPACNWYGRTINLTNRHEVADIPLAARISDNGGIFNMRRLIIPIPEEAQEQVFIELKMRMISYAEIMVRTKINGTAYSEPIEIKLPRLFH